MKLLFSYTLDYLKRNRRSSMAIMVALLMVSTMISALCGMLYTMYTDNLSYYLRELGNWHGELFDNSNGNDLAVVESFDSVETTLLKGPWMTAKIDDPRREYLIFRNADSDYWESMPEGNIGILEGRVPAADGEIALSKQYFEHHPELQLGDTITLPLGNRVLPDGTVVPPQDVAVPGEQFAQTGSVSLTVVAKQDVATSSTVPGYTALGYLDRSTIAPDSELTIYMRFKNMHDTFGELPKIAAAVGYTVDEYGQYNLRYNTAYLNRQLVFSSKQLDAMSLLEMGQMPLMFALMGLLTAGIFVLVIHNAFALSANARLAQLGVLASVGATPRQIKRSVVLEAFLLAAVPLPLGLGLGQLAVWLLITRMNSFNAQIAAEVSEPIVFTVGWLSLLPAILLSILTLWWSATIPARRVARMTPIEAIRHSESVRFKKVSRLSIWAHLGPVGELAAGAVRARRRSYRTATGSLALSFLTLSVLVCIQSASTASQAVYGHLEEYRWSEKNISITLQNVASPQDFAVTKEIEAVAGVKNVLWRSEQPMAAWIAAERFSPEFTAAGSFEGAAGVIVGLKLPILRDGSYRLQSTLVGLDDKSFAAYCAQLGLEATQFYEPSTLRTILYHTTEDVTRHTRRNPVQIPLLDIKPGDTLTLTEKLMDDFEGDFTCDTEVTAITEQYPPMGDRNLSGRFGMVQFMPMSQLNTLRGQLAKDRTSKIYGSILVNNPQQIATARAGIEQICESWFGSGDYGMLDYNDILLNEQGGEASVNMMFGFVSGIFAIIGLSNAWATVRGTLNARRREFAMLRSVGLPPRGLRKMLIYESMVLGLSPILASLPFIVAIQAVFLSINEVTFAEWLPHAPWLVLLVYVTAILAVIVAAYVTGGRKLLEENIIDGVKTDSV